MSKYMEIQSQIEAQIKQISIEIDKLLKQFQLFSEGKFQIIEAFSKKIERQLIQIKERKNMGQKSLRRSNQSILERRRQVVRKTQQRQMITKQNIQNKIINDQMIGMLKKLDEDYIQTYSHLQQKYQDSSRIKPISKIHLHQNKVVVDVNRSGMVIKISSQLLVQPVYYEVWYQKREDKFISGDSEQNGKKGEVKRIVGEFNFHQLKYVTLRDMKLQS